MNSEALTLVNEDIKDYLCLIQNVIDRMSTTSAIIKGFTATVITGIAALSFTDINKWILLLSFLPVLSFFALDVFYLSLERRYRYLYEQVRTNKHQADFILSIDKHNKAERKASNATFLKCIASESIYLFYGSVLVVIFTTCYLKFCGYLC